MFGRLRLQSKMTLWYTLLTFITVAAFAAALYWMTDYVLGEMLEQDARLLMQQITAQIEEEHGLLTYENEVPVSKDTMFFITEEDGSELASYGDDITVFDDIAMEPDVFHTAQGGAKRWLLLDSGVITVEHARLRVRVACSMATDDRVLSAMRWAFFISIPIIVLFSALGGLFIARRSLKPIRQIIHSAEIIAAGDLSARIPAVPAKDELGELTDTLNHMLQSVEEAFIREKRFTSDASHELRTPVSVIRAYAESLRAAEGLTPEDAGSLDTVLAECARMQKIIAQLLTITRVEEGRYPICFETVDLHAAAQGVADTLTGLCGEKGLSVAVAVDDGLTLRADQSLMTEMLLNLAENAVKYGKAGGLVELSAAREGGYVVVRVRDDGIGIPEDALPHIFERFYRVDGARDRSGTGLGLSIVDWIVKAHHGTITVESQPGFGTTFTITLPDADNA